MRLIVLCCACLLLGACEYRINSSKLYDTTSTLEEGKKVIAAQNIQYMCEGVWELLWADLRRGSDCFYTIKQGEQYFKADVAAIQKLGIVPVFSFWAQYGIWIAIPIVIIIIVISVRLGMIWT